MLFRSRDSDPRVGTPADDHPLESIVAAEDPPGNGEGDPGDQKTQHAHHRNRGQQLQHGGDVTTGDGAADRHIGHRSRHPRLDLFVDHPVQLQPAQAVIDPIHDDQRIKPDRTGGKRPVHLTQRGAHPVGNAAAQKDNGQVYRDINTPIDIFLL